MASQRLPAFRGRASERETLDQLLERVRVGESGVLIIRGEPGVGKTALLRYAARQAAGFRVAQIAGVESEMELPYAGLHQLCAPMLGQLDALPAPQEAALRVAFGLASGPAPDRFLVALATLSLLAHVAEERPLLCLVDDGQWLDEATGQVLGFVGRRLLAEPMALVFAARQSGDGGSLAGLPELRLEGLPDDDARALLATVVPGRLDERVRDRIVAETRGNPLALLELPRGMSAAELAGGFAVPETGDLPDQIEGRYLVRVGELPEATQRLMLLAAADAVGDATLVWRAARALDIEREAAAPAAREQLLDIGVRVRFRHPLVRSAVYGAASGDDRRAAHRALAAATDPDTDPERRAWHRAQATPGPDDEVATELEHSAGRARARGGLAAAAAFLERSANLTVDPAQRVERLLAAAQLHIQSGAFEPALALLAAAESGTGDELASARVELLRGWVAAASSTGAAPAQLLEAARRLEPLDPQLARGTYLDAWGAAMFAGRLAGPGGSVLDVARAVRESPASPHPAGAVDRLLDGFAALVTEGRAAAEPALRAAIGAFCADEVPVEQWLQWGVLGSAAAVTVWDFESWESVSTRQIELARAAGALVPLSIALNGQAMLATWTGSFEVAAALSAEDEALKEATGTHIAPYGAVLLAAYQGRTTEASALVDDTIRDSVERGEGLGIELARWATAILDNSLGRYDEAFAAATDASDEGAGLYISDWALVELIEAAVRTGRTKVAGEAQERLTEATDVRQSAWATGIQARSGALLSERQPAESRYRQAIDCFERTPVRTELARSRLLFGEWLRRQNRRVEARAELRTAYDLFATMGADGFADRARRELLATGEQVRKRRVGTRDELTPQEEHIARLARDGRTNPEIGAELYISARTVEWHLRKVFTKLGISSRRGLQAALPSRSRDAASA
jgi:DNA-binding CsgD family transcriptional regulator